MRRTNLATTLGSVAALAAFGPLAAGQHTIRSGETLSGIALRYGTSVSALTAANGIDDPHRIVAGRSLTIPAASAGAPAPVASPAPATGTYLVKMGDTMSAIARRHGVSVSALASANGIADPHRIVAGRTLTIPGSASGAPTSGAPATPAPPPASETTYTVQAGDTLSRIAARFGTTAVELAARNNLRSVHMIRIGQQLTVPGAEPATPREGDLPERLLAAPDRLAYLPLFVRWAGEHGVPADLLMAMTWLESGWQNGVVSSVGARGIGQLMPDTVRFVNGQLLGGAALDPAVPEDNIRLSARFLRYLLDASGGDASLALAGYYQGLASVRRHGMFTATRAYVGGVLALRDRYSWTV